MSGNACKIFLRSSFAHTIKAFIGLFIWLPRLSEKWRDPKKKIFGIKIKLHTHNVAFDNSVAKLPDNLESYKSRCEDTKM